MLTNLNFKKLQPEFSCLLRFFRPRGKQPKLPILWYSLRDIIYQIYSKRQYSGCMIENVIFINPSWSFVTAKFVYNHNSTICRNEFRIKFSPGWRLRKSQRTVLGMYYFLKSGIQEKLQIFSIFGFIFIIFFLKFIFFAHERQIQDYFFSV